MEKIPILSLITFLPLAGALILIFINRNRENLIRYFSFAISLLNFIVSLKLYINFNPGLSSFQFQEEYSWIGMGINYTMGIDGLSLFLVLLTTFLMPISFLCSWTAIEDRVKEFNVFMLLLSTGMIGVFVSLNLFLFYVFWEVTLIPMYFLIGIWGTGRKIYVTIKFILFTMLGSLLMLVSFFVLYSIYYKATGSFSLDFQDLSRLILSPSVQIWLFLGFSISFAIKVPLFPFHTWLPDAHTEAPTAGSVLLAGVLLKMGAYGFIRFAFTLFPDALMICRSYIVLLSLVGIIYGGLMALAQKDVKRLVAYSSVSHMGMVMLGLLSLNRESVEGAIYQMLSHGISTGGLFLVVGFLYEKAHTRIIDEFGGLSKQLPLFSAIFVIIMLSSIGLPGLNGFIGEFLILIGVFKVNVVWTALGATGIILSVAYLLWAFQRVMQGKIKNERFFNFKDLNLRELFYFLPIIFFIFWMGIYPNFILKRTENTISKILNDIKYHEKIVVEDLSKKIKFINMN
ncbi:MAG: NADH-quinone oxidoreductase subunit M [Acidobacteriota bacterium]